MNIYKTKDGQYINMDNVFMVDARNPENISIGFAYDSYITLKDDAAKSFLDYLNRRLNTVFEGYA